MSFPIQRAGPWPRPFSESGYAVTSPGGHGSRVYNPSWRPFPSRICPANPAAWLRLGSPADDNTIERHTDRLARVFHSRKIVTTIEMRKKDGNREWNAEAVRQAA
jgi:hypothetical protein